MNILQALSYFVSEAISNLVRGWRISMLAVATTALSLFIGGLLLLAGNNLTRAIENWRADAQVVVYLDADLTEDEIGALADELRGLPGVVGLVEVGPDQARERFEERFPELGEVLLEFERSPFPVSLELETSGAPELMEGWLGGLNEISGVAGIDNDADWLANLNTVASLASASGLFIGGILMIAAAISIASVVRLSTFIYRKEIAAMRLIGATEFFVRGPFVVEGLVQGLAGSGIALGALWLVFLGFGRLDLPWFVQDALLGFFMTPTQALALLAVGGVAGLVGGIIPLRERAGVFG